MGLINNIKKKMTERRQKRLEEDLLMINQKNRVSYNPKLLGIKSQLAAQDEFTIRMAENYAWLSANAFILREFYTEVYKPTGKNSADTQNFFWLKAKSHNRKVHTGIPKLISETMARILFAPGYTQKVEVFNIDDNGVLNNETNEEQSKKATEALNLILQDNKINELNQEAAIIESASGFVVYKISVDQSLTKFPIIEIADSRTVELDVERRRIKSIIFKKWIKKDEGTKDEKEYIYSEIYTIDIEDYSLILNGLQEIKKDGQLVKVPLTTIEETENLEEIIKPGTQGMLAFYKVNKATNSEFYNSNYGQSDYAGCYGSFDVLDEIYSEIAEETRRNKTIRYIPKSMIPVDSSGRTLEKDDFNNDYVIVNSDADQDTKNQITAPKMDGRQVELESKWRSNLAQILNLSGLSPLTIGVTGLESMASSDASQQERQRATLATRESKAALWKEFLEKVFLKLLEVNSIIQTQNEQFGVDNVDIEWANCNVSIQFNSYISDTIQARIETWGAAYNAGVASLDFAIKQIHQDDLTLNELTEEINRIKIEKNLSLDNPENLLSDIINE